MAAYGYSIFDFRCAIVGAVGLISDGGGSYQGALRILCGASANLPVSRSAFGNDAGGLSLLIQSGNQP
jgi:hypothetical protein